MSRGPAQRRAVQAWVAALAAVLLLVLGLGSVWRDAALGAPPQVSGPAAPGWAGAAGGAAAIEIESANTAFRLERRGESWVMPSRGDHPVEAARIAALDAALGALTLERAMTRDPEKFDRLGLGDPGQGGAGVQLRVLSDQGEPLAELVAGAPAGDAGMYLRRLGGARAYAARGRLPELDDPGLWLGLAFWDLDASAIARVEIQPETGPVWRAQRAGVAQRNYELRGPAGWRLVTGGAANGVATAGARLRFRDVRPADTLAGPVVARHAAVTFSGLAYTFEFQADDAARWAVIRAEAVADDAAPRAARLNDRVEGWAFRVSEDAYERLTRPLIDIAEPAVAPP